MKTVWPTSSTTETRTWSTSRRPVSPRLYATTPTRPSAWTREALATPTRGDSARNTPTERWDLYTITIDTTIQKWEGGCALMMICLVKRHCCALLSEIIQFACMMSWDVSAVRAQLFCHQWGVMLPDLETLEHAVWVILVLLTIQVGLRDVMVEMIVGLVRYRKHFYVQSCLRKEDKHFIGWLFLVKNQGALKSRMK